MIPLKMKEYLKFFDLVQFMTMRSPCSLYCNLDGGYSKYMIHEVYIRSPSNPNRELLFLETIISCIKILEQFNKIDVYARKQHYLNKIYIVVNRVHLY